MKITYNDILNSMKDAYYRQSGEMVEKQTDLEMRFKAVASELYSVLCSGEFMLRQAFPQTASGEYLEKHAQLRGITRKNASKAYGEVTFSVSSPAESDITIPQGTVCASASNPYLQYLTGSDAVIEAGETETTVAVSAACEGAPYNVPAENVTVLVNPPLGAETVVNRAPISFGTDRESDEALRKRIVASYSIPQSGMSSKSLRECIMRIDEVLDCSISFSLGRVNVTVRTADGRLSPELENTIIGAFYFREMLPYSVRVNNAQPMNYSLDINVRVNTEAFDDVEAEISAAVRSCTDMLGLGDTVNISEILYSISKVDSVKYAEIICDEAQDGIITVAPDKYPFLSEIRVNCYE